MRVADLLAERLVGLGVRRLFGDPLPLRDDRSPVLHQVPLDEPELATLLADADGRIGEVDGRGRLGAALIPGGVLHLSSQPSGRAPVHTVGSVEELVDVLVDLGGVRIPDTSALHLDLDLGAPVPDGLQPSVSPERRPVLTLSPSMDGLSMVLVVGSGVVRAGSVRQMQEVARRAGVGVLNTWGAKGVERWDSAWHLGTAGLQVDDLQLAGLGRVDVVLTSGVDPAELPPEALGSALVQDVPPTQLGALCADWPVRVEPPPGPPTLFDAIAGVVRPLYERGTAPINPARASLHLSGSLPDGAVALADAGPAGFWVARTFPTSIPSSVCVPANRADGFAVAGALCAGLDGRAALAVTDEAAASQEITGAALELADSLGVGIGLQVWGADGDRRWSTAEGHVELLRLHLDAAATASVRVDRVGIDLEATDALVALAGAPVSQMRHD